MALQGGDIADLIIASTKDLGRMKWTDLSSDLQEFVVMPNLLKKKRVEFSSSGYAAQWNLVTDDNGSFRWTGLYEVDEYNVPDVARTATVPYRHCNANYSIEDREVKMNGGENRVLDLVKLRRVTAMISMADGWETAFWGKPTDSTDTEKLFGVDYWIVKNATEGFNGGNPSGFTSGAAGVSSTTVTRWANWTSQYVNVTRTDFIRRCKRAIRKTHFTPPVDVPQYGGSRDHGFYTNDDVITALDELLEDQNESLGNDLYSKEGQLMISRTPVTWVPKLDSDSQDPFYGVNWGKFKFAFLKGEYMNEQAPRQASRQHRTRVVDVDCSANAICYDRRSQFILNIA